MQRRSPFPRAQALAKRRSTSSAPAPADAVRQAIEKALGVEAAAPPPLAPPSADPPALAPAPAPAVHTVQRERVRGRSRVLRSAKERQEEMLIVRSLAYLATDPEELRVVEPGETATLRGDGMALKFRREPDGGWWYEGATEDS